uniref:Uncharacterized protein n=1 Tax=Rhizophora mucronata TaxID=61149 RepID=A0A2P2NP68_RHIMU
MQLGENQTQKEKRKTRQIFTNSISR